MKISSWIGITDRLNRLFNPLSGKTFIVPMDHGITQGPLSGLINYEEKIKQFAENGVNAIIGHAGLILRRKENTPWTIPFILHISASSDLSSDPNHKVLVNTIEEAIRLAAVAVSVHINIGGKDDGFMLETLGNVARECRKWGMPLIAMMYPRGENISSQGEYALENVKKVARIGAELGADIVKTNYTGDIDSFKEVVKGCPVPVIIAGGSETTPKKLVTMAWECIQAGGKGVSFGRNLFQSPQPAKLAHAISLIVHEGNSVEEALQKSNLSNF
ncbi:MAG: class I fructose-bisphosphate aldolase family protein [Candidatus Lokiarchaeota archaeon]|nr:class I fructose-bisphosphate aldolase family protein [Candidatus Harpocratesius repetitus]